MGVIRENERDRTPVAQVDPHCFLPLPLRGALVQYNSDRLVCLPFSAIVSVVRQFLFRNQPFGPCRPARPIALTGVSRLALAGQTR